MRRREFLVGSGSLFLAGCAGEPRAWSEVPWVAAAPPVVAPPPLRPAPSPAAAPAVGAGPACAAGLRYRVLPGDTLASLARRSGCPVGTLVTANRLTSANLAVGQELLLPGCRHLGPDPLLTPSNPACSPVAGGSWRVVPRAEWGAQTLRANHDPMGAIRRITLHHTDEHSGMCGRSDAEVVRAIQSYHQDAMGWADIGYHYLVGHDGRVYEGRSVAAQGAHSGGANNRNNLGISVIGNFSCALPAPTQLAALRGFLADRQAAYGIGPAAVFGHRDLSATECPGSALYAWLQDLRLSRA